MTVNDIQPKDELITVIEDHKGRWIAVNSRTGRFHVQGGRQHHYSLATAKEAAEKMAKRRTQAKRKPLKLRVLTFGGRGYESRLINKTSAKPTYHGRTTLTTLDAEGKADNEFSIDNYGLQVMALEGHYHDDLDRAMSYIDQAERLEGEAKDRRGRAYELLKEHSVPEKLKNFSVQCVEDALIFDEMLTEWADEERKKYPAKG